MTKFLVAGWTLLIIAVSLHVLTSFQTPSRILSYVKTTRSSPVVSRQRQWISSKDEPSSTWVIDEDTSEILVESSADISRRIAAEKARVEAEIALQKKLEEERIKAELLAAEEEMKKKLIVESQPTTEPSSDVVVQEAKITPPPAQLPKKSFFDIGLIILFPIMIGTLLLFLFFPIIGQQLAGSLPPPTS
mmetsp:Transcript_4740/g.6510  ORF Transcript_4740/g.6510 Transcript_4740/m.6510 type:complete len:190 (+) Transcript_4740:38-607(+)